MLLGFPAGRPSALKRAEVSVLLVHSGHICYWACWNLRGCSLLVEPLLLCVTHLCLLSVFYSSALFFLLVPVWVASVFPVYLIVCSSSMCQGLLLSSHLILFALAAGMARGDSNGRHLGSCLPLYRFRNFREGSALRASQK